MRPCAIVLFAACLLLVVTSPSSSAVVKLSLVIPEGHKVTDVNLRFESQRSKTEGSFEGGVEEEDEEDEGPSFRRGPGASGGAGKEAPNGRQRKIHNMVETFPAVAKKAEEGHATINKVIKLPPQKLVSIRK